MRETNSDGTVNNTINLYHGDCLELMKNIPDNSIDLVLCDLPYQTTSCRWDKQIPFEPLWAQWHRVTKPASSIVLFGSEPFSSYIRLSNIDEYKYDWIWKKESGTGGLQSKNMPLKDYENICVFSKGNIGHVGLVKNRMTYYPQGLEKCDKIQRHGSWGTEGTMERKSQSKEVRVFQEHYPRMVLEFKRDSKSKLHPTQKPVALLEYLIKTYTAPGNTVLDNCMGSGSTGVACIHTSRSFIGIELDAEYFNAAKKRIEEAETCGVQTQMDL